MSYEIGRSHVLFLLTKKNSNPIMTDKFNRGRRYAPSVRIAAEAESIDTQGNIRTIRYVRGQRSIYLDEQTQGNSLSVTRNITKPVFENGQLMVPTTQKTLLEFLRAHPSNLANQGWDFPDQSNMFYEDRPQERAEKFAKQAEKEGSVIEIVIRGDFKGKLLPVARAKKIPVNRAESLVKRDLLMFAQRNPDEFLELYDSPAVGRYGVLAEAEELQLVVFETHAVKWPDGTTICHVPAGKDPLSYFADITFDPQFREVYAHIVNQINKPNSGAQDDDIIDKAGSDREDALSSMSHEELFEMAKSRMFIKKQGAYYALGEQKHKGKAAFIDAMNKDEDLKSLVIASLMQ